MANRKKDNRITEEKTVIKDTIKKLYDKLLDTLFYIAAAGILASFLIMAWVSVALGIKILATSIVLMIAVVIFILTTTKEEEENASKK